MIRHNHAMVIVTVIGIFFINSSACQAEEIIYGCYKNINGQLRIVANSGECLPSESSISLFGVQVKPLEFTVNCNDGDTVKDALAQAPDTGTVTITVHGVCYESIQISRDDVTLKGGSPGDGLEGVDPGDGSVYVPPVIDLNSAQRIRLNKMTIRSGGAGINAHDLSSFFASNLHIDASATGIVTSTNATGFLRDSTVENCAEGVTASQGGTLRVRDSLITKSKYGGAEASSGGHVYLSQGTVLRENEYYGAQAYIGGSIDLNYVVAENNNGVGVTSYAGDIVINNSIIKNNDGPGIRIINRGFVNVAWETLVESNIGPGISVENSSSLQVDNGAIIRNNSGDGIQLFGVSAASFPRYESPIEITNNGGYGINCLPDTLAWIDWEDYGTVSGNALGQINCSY